MTHLKKFVAIGPESTGKSTLCELLADHYNTIWCREYAREFLETNGNDYTYDDLLLIARGQLELEDAAARQATLSKKNLIFVDTDMYVMKVWCEFVFGKCHRFILDQIAERKYDGYFLCYPDLPWQEDALREYPDEKIRLELFHYYKDLLTTQCTPWCEVSGDYDSRVKKAIHFIDTITAHSPD